MFVIKIGGDNTHHLSTGHFPDNGETRKGMYSVMVATGCYSEEPWSLILIYEYLVLAFKALKDCNY